MSKHITLLSALLLLQLVIAGILFSTDSNTQDISAKSLISIHDSDLEKIQIIEDGHELILIKQTGRWHLKDYPELPLRREKVNSLTKNLVTTQVTWPITSTKGSHERFKVAIENNQKQLVFTDSKGKSQTLLLGSSPSYKQLYVRNMAENDVYSIEYSAYQVSAEPNEWLDKSLLSITNVNEIRHEKINIRQKDKVWQLISPTTETTQQHLNAENVQNLVDQLSRLSVSGIAEKSYEPKNKLVVLNDKNTQFTYYFATEDEHYFIKRTDVNQWFTLPKSNFEQLTNLTLDNFILKDEQPVEEEK